MGLHNFVGNGQTQPGTPLAGGIKGLKYVEKIGFADADSFITDLYLHAVLPLNEEIELAAIENKTIFDLNDDNPVLGPTKELLYAVSTKS